MGKNLMQFLIVFISFLVNTQHVCVVSVSCVLPGIICNLAHMWAVTRCLRCNCIRKLVCFTAIYILYVEKNLQFWLNVAIVRIRKKFKIFNFKRLIYKSEFTLRTCVY
jgi:hypothetical protein